MYYNMQDAEISNTGKMKEQLNTIKHKLLASYFEHWGLFLTDEHTDVWVTQVSAVDLLVSASRIDVCKGLIDLQGPNPFIVHPVGGDTPLLAK